MATNELSSFCSARDAYQLAKADVDSLGTDYENAEADYYVDIQYTAFDALMLTPAPDLSALIYKLEMFAAEDCFGMSPQYRDPLFAGLIADARRLDEEPAKGCVQ